MIRKVRNPECSRVFQFDNQNIQKWIYYQIRKQLMKIDLQNVAKKNYNDNDCIRARSRILYFI